EPRATGDRGATSGQSLSRKRRSSAACGLAIGAPDSLSRPKLAARTNGKESSVETPTGLHEYLHHPCRPVRTGGPARFRPCAARMVGSVTVALAGGGRRVRTSSEKGVHGAIPLSRFSLAVPGA